MTALRSVLDRLNDIEATIAQIVRNSGHEPSFGIELSLRSLESRRNMLKEELADLTSSEFIDVCDYRILPENAESYAMNAVTGAWHQFQDILSFVFASVETDQPRNSGKLSRDVIEKTQLNFGYAYAGSLGVVMTIRNDRFLLTETILDKSVAAVFDVIKATSAEKILEAKHRFGVPIVRKLYNYSKLHTQYGMTADVKWVRSGNVRQSVLAQPSEFAEICRIIEEKSDSVIDPTVLTGTLSAWNTRTRTFVLEFAEGEPISGHWADDFVGPTRTVPAMYRAALTKITTINYAEEKDEITWILNRLDEADSA